MIYFIMGQCECHVWLHKLDVVSKFMLANGFLNMLISILISIQCEDYTFHMIVERRGTRIKLQGMEL